MTEIADNCVVHAVNAWPDKSTQATVLIDKAVKASREGSFIEEYWPTITDADALGVAVSKWAEWGGDKIAEAFFSALEDSNYHTERADFILLWNDRHGTDFH